MQYKGNIRVKFSFQYLFIESMLKAGPIESTHFPQLAKKQSDAWKSLLITNISSPLRYGINSSTSICNITLLSEIFSHDMRRNASIKK